MKKQEKSRLTKTDEREKKKKKGYRTDKISRMLREFNSFLRQWCLSKQGSSCSAIWVTHSKNTIFPLLFFSSISSFFPQLLTCSSIAASSKWRLLLSRATTKPCRALATKGRCRGSRSLVPIGLHIMTSSPQNMFFLLSAQPVPL